MADVIAEMCQNHRGDRRLLLDMVWAAAEAGATFAKMQAIWADDLTYRERFEEGTLDASGRPICIRRPYGPEYQRLRPMDLTPEDYWAFVQECGKAGLTPMVTVFTRARIAMAVEAGFRVVKVASYDCASLPLLGELGTRFDALYVSTGATFDDEIAEAARVLSGRTFALLHCVTIYPTPLDALSLKRMTFLRKYTDKVGFSDHTLVERDGLKATLAAIYLGADVVERHFTILPRDRTKDGPVSINPAELKELAGYARAPRAELEPMVRRLVPELPTMLGDDRRELTHEERLNRDYYRGRFASYLPSAPRRPVYNWDDDVRF